MGPENEFEAAERLKRLPRRPTAGESTPERLSPVRSRDSTKAWRGSQVTPGQEQCPSPEEEFQAESTREGSETAALISSRASASVSFCPAAASGATARRRKRRISWRRRRVGGAGAIALGRAKARTTWERRGSSVLLLLWENYFFFEKRSFCLIFYFL